MTDEQKNQFDALEVLRRSAWESLDHRRPFEWKVSIALWTAYAAFIGTTVTGKGTSITTASAWVTGILALLVLALHWLWLRGIYRSYNADKRIVILFRNEMMKKVGVEFPEDLEKILKDVRGTWVAFFRNWNSVFQFGVTGVLTFAAILVVVSGVQSTKRPALDYRVIASDIPAVQRDIDRLAADGWEVVTITAAASPTNAHEALILLRKTK